MKATPAPSGRAWLVNALITVVLWGVWGAFSDQSAKHGFPDTLVYCVWALTMIPPAFIALRMGGNKLELSGRAIAYGMAIGLLGAGGQMVLFYALTRGPAYLIFPIISLSPLVTIVMSFALLGERPASSACSESCWRSSRCRSSTTRRRTAAASGSEWFILALIVLLSWGVQAYFMKSANNHMSAEGIFFYMMIAGLLLIPVAWLLTDHSHGINWGWTGIDRRHPGAERDRRADPGVCLPLRQGDHRRSAQQRRCAARYRRDLPYRSRSHAGHAQDHRPRPCPRRVSPAGDRTGRRRRERCRRVPPGRRINFITYRFLAFRVTSP